MGLLQKKQEWNMATTASSATTTFAISSTITAVVKDTLHHVEEPMIIGKQQKRKINDGWLCPVSKKSSRTLNPVSNVVEPLAKRIKLGCQRKDKKDPISLAVSIHRFQIPRKAGMSICSHLHFPYF